MTATEQTEPCGCPRYILKALGLPTTESPMVRLLEQVAQYGSINRAAKAAGLSYKSAWEQLESLNNLAEKPLLHRSVGGKGGGGTELTEEGRLLLDHCRMLQSEYRKFLALFAGPDDRDLRMAQLLRRLAMKVSARNTWAGKIADVDEGAINCTVYITLMGGDRIVASVTRESVDRLALKTGVEVLAMVKAPSVVLCRGLTQNHLTACNVLAGTVSRIIEGAVNDEVVLNLPGGSTVTTVAAKESIHQMGLTVGDRACAMVKAASVMLAVV